MEVLFLEILLQELCNFHSSFFFLHESYRLLFDKHKKRAPLAGALFEKNCKQNLLEQQLLHGAAAICCNHFELVGARRGFCR